LNIKYHNPKREFLSQEELSKLYHSPTRYEEVKNAFVFGCFTGLRFVDLFNLKFTDIKEGRLIVKQQKTQEVISIMLNETALEILKNQREKNKDNVFNITSYDYWKKVVKKIIKDAGIEKNITGHCARHTFATLCITQGVDIFTTSKLLGHANVTTTQIYAKLIDKKKDEAIMMLPTL
jgi:integrase